MLGETVVGTAPLFCVNCGVGCDVVCDVGGGVVGVSGRVCDVGLGVPGRGFTPMK